MATGNWRPWTGDTGPIDTGLEGGRNRTGKGEHKYAAEVSGSVMGGRGQDVRKPDGRVVEVKYLSTETGYITPGEDGYLDVADFVHCVRTTSKQVKYWIDEWTCSKDPRLKAHGQIHLRIMEGELSAGVILGGTSKYPIGLLQVLESTQRFCEAVPSTAKLWLPDPFEYSICWEPGIRQSFNLFRRPSDLTRLYYESSLPSRVFKHADQVAIVSDAGYFEIDRDNYDEHMYFVSISMGRPRFKLAKA